MFLPLAEKAPVFSVCLLREFTKLRDIFQDIYAINDFETSTLVLLPLFILGSSGHLDKSKSKLGQQPENIAPFSRRTLACQSKNHRLAFRLVEQSGQENMNHLSPIL